MDDIHKRIFDMGDEIGGNDEPALLPATLAAWIYKRAIALSVRPRDQACA